MKPLLQNRANISPPCIAYSGDSQSVPFEADSELSPQKRRRIANSRKDIFLERMANIMEEQVQVLKEEVCLMRKSGEKSHALLEKLMESGKENTKTLASTLNDFWQKKD